MMQPLRIIASPGIVEGQAVAFEAFERNAARIMRCHGRRVERAIRPARGAWSARSYPSKCTCGAFLARLKTL